MRCIETRDMILFRISPVMIKSNMRCIETYLTFHALLLNNLIKSNMRCIETDKVHALDGFYLR